MAISNFEGTEGKEDLLISKPAEQLVQYEQEIYKLRLDIRREEQKGKKRRDELDKTLKKLKTTLAVRGYVVKYEKENDKVFVSVDRGNRIIYVIPRPARYSREEIVPKRRSTFILLELLDSYKFKAEKFLVKECPDMTYDDIGGLESVKEEHREYTELQLDPEISKEMAEAVANEAGVPFLGINVMHQNSWKNGSARRQQIYAINMCW